jgi:hypothetical protein
VADTKLYMGKFQAGLHYVGWIVLPDVSVERWAFVRVHSRQLVTQRVASL